MSELQTSNPSVIRTTAERVRGRGRGGGNGRGNVNYINLKKMLTTILVRIFNLILCTDLCAHVQQVLLYYASYQ